MSSNVFDESRVRREGDGKFGAQNHDEAAGGLSALAGLANQEPDYVNRVWYHGGEKPEGNRYIHIGTEQAATERIDPRLWDPPAEFPEIGGARMWRVRLRPETRVHPEVGVDYNHDGDWSESVGSCDFKMPQDFDAKPYINDNEDAGSISLLIHGSMIESVEEVEDPHRQLRKQFRREALEALEDDPEERDAWAEFYGDLDDGDGDPE